MSPLTGRQAEVMNLTAQGLTIKEVAAQLGVSPATAKVHREAAIERLGAKNITHASVLWDRRKMIHDHQS